VRIGLPKGTVKRRSARLIEALTGQQIEPRRLAYANDQLTCFLLKHRDIPVLMKSGDLDLGITSTEWLAEKGPELEVLHRTNWCDTRISLVGTERSCTRVRSGDRFSCVTEFPVLATRYLAERGLLERAIRQHLGIHRGAGASGLRRRDRLHRDRRDPRRERADRARRAVPRALVLVGLPMRRDIDALAEQIKEHLA
jgi:hypothetical protein